MSPGTGLPSARRTASGIVLPPRAMLIGGGTAAIAAAAAGLAVLVILCLVAWITAPHVGIGGGLGSVLRDAGLLWLVAHHVEVNVHGAGRIGLLPLGLVLLPGLLLERAGRWLTNAGHVTRLRHVGYAALAIACPYALFTLAVALGSSTGAVRPSLAQAAGWGFLLALVAGGFGAAHGLAPWRKLTGLLPSRTRSVVLGVAAALGAMMALGALLNAVSLGLHLHAYQAAVNSLAPGPFGSALLLLAEIAYLPNSVIWAISYTLGPGFAFGAGTAVSPSGSALGALPAFPMLASLPAGPGPAFPAWLGFFVLATPYLAGALAGIVTIRIAPTPFLEAAPLWGLLTGTLAGVILGVLAQVSGGPLGAGRLASVGPNGGEAGLVAVLEVGVTSALVAGAANWLLLRHHIRRLAAATADGNGVSGGIGGVNGINSVSSVIGPTGEDWPSAPSTGLFAWTASNGDNAGAANAAWTDAPVTVDETDDAGGHRIFVDPWAEHPDDD